MRDYNKIPFKQNKRESTASSNPPSESPTEATTNTISQPSSSLAPSDALRVRREGPEATIQYLRAQLDEYVKKDNEASTQVSRLQAEKLELRSQIRQLERQVQNNAKSASNHQQQASASPELQKELDNALMQLRTADMVRKELEDTLEAEMYTWDLRVKDQERTILQMQQDYNILQDDLDKTRQQWTEAEAGWTQEIHEARELSQKAQQECRMLKAMQNDSSDAAELKDRIIILERERSELQGCLDEALKELEAVDQELQGDDMTQLREENNYLREQLNNNHGDNLTEPLQALYKYLLERDGFEDSLHKPPKQPREIIRAIETHIQNTSIETENDDVGSLRKQIQELQGQISVQKGDLQAREESSAELRSSLKEAVALLKPLQEAVAKVEREKAEIEEELEEMRAASNSRTDTRELRRQLDEKDDELEEIKERLEKTEIELSRAKIQAAAQFVSPQKDDDSVLRTREELSAKRAQERTIQAMLATAQNRFRDLEGKNQEVEALNSELRVRLDSAHQRVDHNSSRDSTDAVSMLQRELESRDIALRDMGKDLNRLKNELEARDRELDQVKQRASDEAMATKLKAVQTRSEQLEWKLRAVKKEVNNRKEHERTLNKSLKEALDLLRPLQSHLEEAEKEKQRLQQQIRQLAQNSGDDVSARSRNVPESVDARMMQHLRDTVQQLENENTQLHNALEELSSSFNISHLSGISNFSNKDEAKLREEIVETKSRYEVTQKRLHEAARENKQLSEALQWKEKRERAMENELKLLRDKLKVSSGGSVGSQESGQPQHQQQLYEHQRQQGQLSGRTTPPVQNGTRSNYRLR